MKLTFQDYVYHEPDYLFVNVGQFGSCVFEFLWGRIPLKVQVMIPSMIYARGFKSTNEAYMPYQAMKQRLSGSEILFLCFVNRMQTTPPPLISIFQHSPILIGPWGSLSWLKIS